MYRGWSELGNHTVVHIVRHPVVWAECTPYPSPPVLFLQAGDQWTDLAIPSIVYPATIDGVLQQPSQLLPVRLTALAVCGHNICTAPNITEVEVTGASPALHANSNSHQHCLGSPKSARHAQHAQQARQMTSMTCCTGVNRCRC